MHGCLERIAEALILLAVTLARTNTCARCTWSSIDQPLLLDLSRQIAAGQVTPAVDPLPKKHEGE